MQNSNGAQLSSDHLRDNEVCCAAQWTSVNVLYALYMPAADCRSPDAISLDSPHVSQSTLLLHP